MPSIEMLLALRKALLAEQQKRAKLRGWPLGSDPRTALYTRLDEMVARRKACGDEVSRPSPAQLADLHAFFAKLGGSTSTED